VDDYSSPLHRPLNYRANRSIHFAMADTGRIDTIIARAVEILFNDSLYGPRLSNCSWLPASTLVVVVGGGCCVMEALQVRVYDLHDLPRMHMMTENDPCCPSDASATSSGTLSWSCTQNRMSQTDMAVAMSPQQK
jgi:hypothetical protein